MPNKPKSMPINTQLPPLFSLSASLTFLDHVRSSYTSHFELPFSQHLVHHHNFICCHSAQACHHAFRWCPATKSSPLGASNPHTLDLHHFHLISEFS
jgi:hypothetical protein